MILKSRSELQSQQSKTMDSIDIDNLIEVPDTPDRLITAAHNSDRNRIVNKDYNNGRMKSQHTEKVKPVTINGNPRLFIHPNSRNISPISQSFKSSRPTTDTTRHDKGKSLCNSNILRSTRHEQSGINRINASRKGVLPLNSFPAIESKSCKLNSTVKTGPSVDRGKGVDFIPESNASVSMQPCTSSKVPQKRMLVRNGCISPHNIMKSKSVAEKHEISSVVKEQQSGSGALACSGSNMVDIKDLIAEAKDSRRCKKEGASVHPSSESVDNSSGSNVNRCSAETERWGTPHNHRKQREIGQPNNRIMQINHRNTEHRDDGIHKEGINRHKEDSASRNPGKRSMSYVADSAGEPSTSRSKRNKNLSGASTANSVSEPNNNNNNNYNNNNNNNNNNDNNNNDNEGSSVRALQIEADEILARELQEQLYGEELTPAVADNMDIPLAFAMPAHQGDSSRSGGSRRRGPPTLNTRAQVQPTTSRRRLSQPRTSSRMSQLRNHFLPNHRQVSSTRNRRNSIFPPNINLDLRMEILETLEAAGDRRLPSDLFQVGREFTEDDYEMLLALDENNHQHGGATRAQINNLPESIVQVENSQECAICLENPSVGETIRHLPCLHRFHKACIDQWLRRKTSCPVCKSSVT